MIDVVIVNWNSREQLRQCVESLVQHAGASLHKIIVVDNGSVDGSAAGFEGFGLVDVVYAAQNLGFARACNVGAARSDSEFILLLNPDTRVFADSIEVPLRFMQQPRSADVGIVGVQAIDELGRIHRTCTRFPTPTAFLVHSFGLNALSSRLFPDYFMREWPHDENREVAHVIGAFFLVRRAVWRRLGGMDERFFMYLEDLDFSCRASQQGWHTWFLASTRIYHKGGGTSDQIRATRLFYSLRSRLMYAGKHFSAFGFFAVTTATLAVEPLVRCAACLLRGQWSGFRETLEAYRSLWGSGLDILQRARRA